MFSVLLLSVFCPCTQSQGQEHNPREEPTGHRLVSTALPLLDAGHREKKQADLGHGPHHLLSECLQVTPRCAQPQRAPERQLKADSIWVTVGP